MHIDLAWYFLDDDGQEQGPVRGSKLRQWIQCGSISQDFRVRLLNWDGYSSVEELWPNSEVAFLLPPDIYGSSGSSRWGYKHQGQIIERHPVNLEQFVEKAADKADKSDENSVEKATPSKETQAQAGTAKSDVEHEIALILAVCPVLRRIDFDPMVRQQLHAFHGLGGAPQVREALEEVRVVIIGRPRETVKSWPAYLYKLLKNAFLKAKAARYEKAGAKRLENPKRI